MGELLISGNGKGHKAIVTWWIAVIAVCVIGAIVCCVIANNVGIDDAWRLGGYTVKDATKNGMYYFGMGGAVFLLALAPFEGNLMHSRISRTAIYVHEKGIKGSSVVPNFPLSFFLYGSIASLQLADFELTYDLISSVDVVNENTLVINTRDAKHKVYAMNSREIRDTIMAQKTKVK